MLRHAPYRFACLALFGSLFATAVCRADFVYDVSVNTGPLNGNTVAAPYYLDFQLISGGGPPSAATIDAFNYGAGGAAGALATQATAGQASGDIASTVSLSASPVAFYNELLQQFTPGNTLAFRVTLSGTLVPPTSTPDGFSFSILSTNPDTTLSNLPMRGGPDNPGQTFVSIDLAAGGPIVHSFGTDNSLSPGSDGIPIDIAAPTVMAVTVVPAPSAAWGGAVLLLLVGVGTFLKRRAAVRAIERGPFKGVGSL